MPRDYVQAHVWLNLAASRFPPGDDRDNAIKLRDVVAERLTPAQLAIAQEIARNWRPKPEQPGAQAATPQPPPGYDLVAPTQPKAPQAQVAQMQVALEALGYDPGSADGIPGSKTRAAIRAYQAAVGLPVDGEVTDALLDSLRAASWSRSSTP